MAVDLAVVPVAGRGTRLLPLTKSQPKEMLPVGQLPVVQYVAEELAASGVRRLVFVTGPGKYAIENHFDINEELISRLREGGQEDMLARLAFEREDLQYYYTRQRRQLGLGHAILCAKQLVGSQSFVVALGDSIIGLHAASDVVKRMTTLFERENADAVIAFETVPRPDVVHYGIAQPKAQQVDHFELARIVEKPAAADAPSCLAVAGRYVFRSSIFEHIENIPTGKGGEIQLTDAIERMLSHGGKVLGVPLESGEKRYDIGNFPSYFRAFLEFALQDEEYGAQLRDFARELLEGLPK
jgi:UTP--glucose-1-phosphate uridylyltransferase